MIQEPPLARQLMKAQLHHSVEITDGLGEIKFGFTTGDVERRLGAPDEAETLDSGTESAVMWFYAEERLQIIFQKSATDEAMRITQLTTSHPAATLWGSRIIARRESEVLALFKTHGYEDFTASDESVGTQSYKSFRIENLRVTLDFRDGLLQHILWGEVESQPAVPPNGEKESGSPQAAPIEGRPPACLRAARTGRRLCHSPRAASSPRGALNCFVRPMARS